MFHSYLPLVPSFSAPVDGAGVTTIDGDDDEERHSEQQAPAGSGAVELAETTVLASVVQAGDHRGEDGEGDGEEEVGG